MHNICARCRTHNAVFFSNGITITHRLWRLRIELNRLAKLKDVVKTHEDIVAECRHRIEAEACRLQGFA